MKRDRKKTITIKIHTKTEILIIHLVGMCYSNAPICIKTLEREIHTGNETSLYKTASDSVRSFNYEETVSANRSVLVLSTRAY